MKRRKFIQKTAVVSTGVGLLGNAAWANSLVSSPKTTQITILHTNDTHSHIEPFPEDHGRNPNQGGVARRATLIQQIREENPNTLLLDAGDIFQGTPYFNFYGGELEFKLMTMLGYDASTLGNHDFDNGIEGLYKQLPHADFDFVIANYDFQNTIMDGKTKEYKIIEKEGVKIGIFGLGIELEGLVNKRMYKETQYLDPISKAQDVTKALRKQENCDLVICLSHLGYRYDGDKVDDLKLAAATSGIDLIIGGHTHSFLKKPTVTKNVNGDNLLVNQVGAYGLYLGRIDFELIDGKLQDGKSTVYIV